MEMKQLILFLRKRRKRRVKFLLHLFENCFLETNVCAFYLTSINYKWKIYIFFQTLNPEWNEEFIFRVSKNGYKSLLFLILRMQVKPAEQKLILQVFDENRLTRDDFLGMVELSLINLPKEQEGRIIPPSKYLLRPRR